MSIFSTLLLGHGLRGIYLGDEREAALTIRGTPHAVQHSGPIAHSIYAYNNLLFLFAPFQRLAAITVDLSDNAHSFDLALHFIAFDLERHRDRRAITNCLAEHIGGTLIPSTSFAYSILYTLEIRPKTLLRFRHHHATESDNDPLLEITVLWEMWQG